MKKIGPACAFVKLACDANLPWESIRYSNPDALMDAFVFRSLGFCLAVELEADFWVVKWRGEEANIRPSALRADPTGIKRMVRAHKNVVDWHEIPWGEYDMVISIGPVVPRKIIKQHPDILWVYRETSIRCGRARRAVTVGPYGGYDLYMDAMLRCSSKLKSLPQSVGTPYTQSPTILRGVIQPTHKPAVFVSSRIIPLEIRKREAMIADWSSVCGLPIRYPPIKGRTTQPVRFFTELTAAKVPRQRQYLDILGSCKYQIVRESGNSKLLGDAVIEAAALGLIVISQDDGIYSQMVCHPKCLVPKGRLPRKNLRLIQKIERDLGLQKEIIEYQDKAIRKKFWEKPLETMHRALELKGTC